MMGGIITCSFLASSLGDGLEGWASLVSSLDFSTLVDASYHFSLLRKMALQCSFPSLLRLTYESLGKVSCCLLCSMLAICPSYTSIFLI